MEWIAALFFFVLLVSCASRAASQITIPLARRQQTGAWLQGSPEFDRARAAFFRAPAATKLLTVPVTNVNYSQYTMSIGIGSPPTNYNLVVDTGSSNTFCGVGIKYNRTSTSISTGQTVSVLYGTARFSGPEYLDQVTLAPTLVITNQSIADATTFEGFGSFDGILGLGGTVLTKHTLSPNKNATIPTVMDNLASQGLIKKRVLGVSFSPSTSPTVNNGALTFGGTDSSLYLGEVTYVPVTKTRPAGRFWGINITSCAYGNHTVVPSSTAGIIDTGTALILLADDFFNSYIDAIPGASLDFGSGLIDIPFSSIPLMQALTFVIGGRSFVLDVPGQLIPQEQNVAWGGAIGRQYGVIVPLGADSGRGSDFVLGQKFMELYYAVFDEDTHQVGFALTNHTFNFT